MSDPENRVDPHDPDHVIEHYEEKSITGSGARLIGQEVPNNFKPPSMSLDTADDDSEE